MQRYIRYGYRYDYVYVYDGYVYVFLYAYVYAYVYSMWVCMLVIYINTPYMHLPLLICKCTIHILDLPSRLRNAGHQYGMAHIHAGQVQDGRMCICMCMGVFMDVGMGSYEYG
ncbi:hypothetical protein EON63_05150 [archaeon]|nr:MAG: hypothetical protein EON63_05150 [archaeon]